MPVPGGRVARRGGVAEGSAQQGAVQADPACAYVPVGSHL